MFVDEISIELDKQGSYYDRMCHTRKIKAALDSSQKFRFTESMMEAVRELVLNKPSSFLKVLPLARIPFELTWLECEIKCSDDKVRRIGFLINSPDTSKGVMIARIFTATSPDSWLPALSVVVDLEVDVPDWKNHAFLQALNMPAASIETGMMIMGGEKHLSVDQLRENLRSRSHEFSQSELDIMQSSDEELLARAEIMKRGLPVIDYLMFKKSMLDANFDWLMRRSSDVVANDMPILIALLGFLNSKSCVARDHVPASRTTVWEGRRQRIHPLYEHHTLRLVLSKGQENRLTSTGLSAEQRRLHLVRGHFKVRKTGIYWWSAFIRGSKEAGFLDKDYVVEP